MNSTKFFSDHKTTARIWHDLQRAADIVTKAPIGMAVVAVSGATFSSATASLLGWADPSIFANSAEILKNSLPEIVKLSGETLLASLATRYLFHISTPKKDVKAFDPELSGNSYSTSGQVIKSGGFWAINYAIVGSAIATGIAAITFFSNTAIAQTLDTVPGVLMYPVASASCLAAASRWVAEPPLILRDSKDFLKNVFSSKKRE